MLAVVLTWVRLFEMCVGDILGKRKCRRPGFTLREVIPPTEPLKLERASLVNREMLLPIHVFSRA